MPLQEINGGQNVNTPVIDGVGYQQAQPEKKDKLAAPSTESAVSPNNSLRRSDGEASTRSRYSTVFLNERHRSSDNEEEEEEEEEEEGESIQTYEPEEGNGDFTNRSKRESHKNQQGNHRSSAQQDNGGDDDEEAKYKNLSFHGITNSLKPNFNNMGRRRSTFHELSNLGTAVKKKFQNTNQQSSNLEDERNKLSKYVQERYDDSENVRDMSSDLIDTLLAGCPAALLSMTHILQDQRNVQRVPLLLNILSVHVNPIKSTDSLHSAKFKIDLEYGVGPNRMKWSIYKKYKDLASLHGTFKAMILQTMVENKLHKEKNTRPLIIPKFPRAFKNDFKNSQHYDEKRRADDRRANSDVLSTSSSNSSIVSVSPTMDQEVFVPQRKNIFFKHLGKFNQSDETDDPDMPLNERLEKYLKILNLALSLRPAANNLFKFYEISPISVLLSYETGYFGKQGTLIMASSAKSNGWRVSHFRLNDWKAMVQRHTAKWFLVRHSYIMFVSDIHSTTPLDVFLVDSHFKIKTPYDKNVNFLDQAKNLGDDVTTKQKLPNKFQLTLQNGERNMKLLFKSENLMKEWLNSITEMTRQTIWKGKNRFDSFAPIRNNCYCKFLVDGRDYFWAISEALTMAQDCIFIHDWWLSPELYMRRPAQGNEEYRIDRILKERASQGVKIFIVVYRNVGATVGTDSSWTKHRFLHLHPNIHVIRSPNQWLQNTYFWAHHEKIAVIDYTIAFIGGIDLCYGRYDTPEHVLRDDNESLVKQTFPGKDYSNARLNDFYDLDKPFEDMYDRQTVPRMPWHDVHMMTIGEIARDLSRHFVQRWNYLLRQKRPSRPTPLLTPPSDLTEEEIRNSPLFQLLQNRSSCECQLLRSSGSWSLGLKKTEHSIQNAYLKMIETSKHYIYMENQFFCSSSEDDGIVIENKIGDAIVDRVIKASQTNQKWKAFILIPLMPAFPSQVDKPDGSSLRLIMQCQYMSICRGENSIFGKLRKLGIEPEDYIQFYSLRNWTEIGPNKRLVTSLLYVHGKVLIVDDRSCIIGSANVNERSMLGNRDSEVAIIVRDTDLVKTTMNGKEYWAGRFAWELRQRLMREHLGCNVDLVEFVERKFESFQELGAKHFKTLHLLEKKSGSKLSKSKCIFSASIELALRDVLSVNYTRAWEKIHGKIPGYGLSNGKNEDSAFENSQTHTDQASTQENGDSATANKPTSGPFENDQIFEKMEKEELPSLKRSFKSVFHSFNNRAGEANLGIRDNKTISTDPRVNNVSVEETENFDNYDPSKPVDPKSFIKDAGKQLFEWVSKNLSNRENFGSDDAGKKFGNTEIADLLPNKEDILNYVQSQTIDDSFKWDLLKRVCYLQHLAHVEKDESRQTGCSVDDGVINGDNTKEQNAVEPHTHNKYGETKSKHSNHKRVLGKDELSNQEIDQLLSFVAMPDQLNPKIKSSDANGKSNINNEKESGDRNGENSGNNDGSFDQKTPSVTDMFKKASFIDPYSFSDPLVDSFFQDLWYSIAVRNTYIYRLIFHCQPDNSVTTWADFHEYEDLAREFDELQKEIEQIEESEAAKRTGKKTSSKSHSKGPNNNMSNKRNTEDEDDDNYGDDDEDDEDEDEDEDEDFNFNDTTERMRSFRLRLSRGMLNGLDKKTFDKYSAKRLLQRVHGHLIIMPYNWMEQEVQNDNWYFNADRVPPIDIYD
ncbi:hypothetical protein ACO0QE_004106 [Hanseniaspora vineae]